eukprot:445796_1
MPKPSKTSSVGPLLPAVPSQPALNHAPPVTVSAYRRAKTILDTANGRDKSLKCVQEVLRLASLMLRIRQQQQNSSMKSASDHSNELISSLDTFTSRISGARAFLRPSNSSVRWTFSSVGNHAPVWPPVVAYCRTSSARWIPSIPSMWSRG